MPESWKNALSKYDYKVIFSEYHRALHFPGHFNQTVAGDRTSTINFEDYFRTNSKTLIPWFEVVFWKMYSQKNRVQLQTDLIIKQIPSTSALQPELLVIAAQQFMKSESYVDFNNFRKLLGYQSRVVATVATFPAFLDPERFPMVDTRVANWVNMHYDPFNTANPEAPKLLPFAYDPTSKTKVLTMSDFSSYIRWIHWTRYTADRLSQVTGNHWRARDVEMAVFTSWGDNRCKHPVMKLNPL
jgi:hypothetical protein